MIPTYNRAQFVATTLDSVFAQEFRDFEVIVIDDGSTDTTCEVLSRYANRIRVLTQENRGVGAARNIGIRHSTGSYVAFLDSDDVWFPWTLSTYAELIDEHCEPAIITGCPFVFRKIPDIEGARHGNKCVEVFTDYFSSSDKWRWFSASSFVIRTDRLLAVGGFHEEWGSEDADLPMKLGVDSGFVHVLAPYTFAYREHQASLKSAPTYSVSGSRTMLKKERDGLYPGGSSRRRSRAAILTRQVRPVSLACLKTSMHQEAWELYRATFWQHVSLGRWWFLFGFPLLALLAISRKNLVSGPRFTTH